MVEFDADTINKIVALTKRCNSAEKQRDRLKEALCRIASSVSDGVKAREIARAALKECES